MRAPLGRDAAFADLTQKGGGNALLISPGPFFTSRRTQLATLAARHAIPTIYGLREFAESGGLMSYGPSFSNVYEQIGVYTGFSTAPRPPICRSYSQPSSS
jgi:putative tryptophan/tyrosine transport system substrate-binding protein